MSGRSIDASDIVPDDVDADELHNRVQATVPDGGNRRCPSCGRKSLRPTSGGFNVQCDHDFACTDPECGRKWSTEEVRDGE